MVRKKTATTTKSTKSTKSVLAKQLKVRANSKAADLLKQLEYLWKKHKPTSIDTDALLGKPGIYYDMPFEEYVRIGGVNFSSLKALDQSPLHYLKARRFEESSATRLGNFIHTAILEPESLLNRYAILPDFTREIGNDPKTKEPYKAPKQTKAYKDLVDKFRNEIKPKLAIDREDFDTLVAINHSIYSHEGAAAVLAESKREVVLIWIENEITCKARIDALSEEYGIILDIKTTGQSIRDFKMDDFGYHQQQAFYQRGYQQLTGETLQPWLGVVEKSEPYAYAQAPINPNDLKLGLSEILAKVDTVRECRRNDSWPTMPDPDYWSLNSWYKPYHGLSQSH